MAASSSLCGVCTLRHISKPSIVWCTECDEGLCIECQEHHSLSRASRAHSTLPITEYQKLPPDVLSISQYCDKHNEKYQIYCKKHESPCCSDCVVESHNECRDIVKLDDVIMNTKTSSAFYDMEQTLNEVSENIEKIHKNRLNNMKTISEERELIEHEIEQTRITINNHLDKIHEKMIKELYKVEKYGKKEISQLLTLLEENKNQIAEYQRNISIIKQHASDLQAFLAMKQLEKNILLKDKFIHSLIDKDTVRQHSIIFHQNSTLKNVVCNAENFGQVQIDTKLQDVILNKTKGNQAQITVPKVESNSIEDINLKLHQTIRGTGNNVYGCCVLPNGQMAFTNYNTGIILFNKNGLHDFDVTTAQQVFDVDVMNEDNKLVVTAGSGSVQYITIIDVKQKQVKKTIPILSDSHGLASTDNELIYAGAEKGIQMISLQTESTNQVIKDNLSSGSYVATFGNQIFYTDHQTNCVNCYSLKGSHHWTFRNDTVLNYPVGIAVDNAGNVFVVGNKSKNVILISADGTQHRQILSSKDGLQIPWSLHFNRSTGQLLVANLSGNAFVYNLT